MSFPVFDILASRADLGPRRMAFEDIVHGDRVNYLELHLRTGRTTALLAGMGVKPGDRVALLSRNRIEFFELLFACARLAAILVPLNWRDELVEESRETISNLQHEVRDVGDEAERATRETENSLELRTRDRYRKLIAKIDKALSSIEEGDYGFCEETGEEIGLARLEARPIATLCLDAQERWELRQRQQGDGR
jgi:DnaK suppressor protein